MNTRKKRRLKRLLSEQQDGQYIDMAGVFVWICRCYYCDFFQPADTLTIDHLVPKVLHGNNHGKNIVLACDQCNRRKGPHIPCPKCGSIKGRIERLPSFGVSKRRLRTCECGNQWVYVHEPTQFYIEDAPWSQEPSSLSSKTLTAS